MRLIQQTIALAAIVASTQGLAATPANYDVTTTADLIELCSVSADDPLYDAAMGFCLGYIDAAIDYHAAITAGPQSAAFVCPDTTTSREAVVTVVVAWSRTNPQYLQGEAPVHGVMRALTEKWPCPGQ